MNKNVTWDSVGDLVRWSVEDFSWDKELVKDGATLSAWLLVSESVDASVGDSAVGMVKWSVHDSLEEATDD